MKTVIVCQTDGNKIKRITYEILSFIKHVYPKNGKVIGIYVGKEAEESVINRLQLLFDKLYLLCSPQYGDFKADSHAEAIMEVVKKENPDVIISGSCSRNKEIFGILAAKLGVGVVVDCIGASVQDQEVAFKRVLYGGRVYVHEVFESRPHLILLKPRVFEPIWDGTKKADIVEVNPINVSSKYDVLKTIRSESGKASLEEADIIVCGGRGLGKPENFSLVEELAQVLKGAVGATRAVVDAGWRPLSEQIGKSGKTVNPLLYIGVGVSGAIHHVLGIEGAKWVVAINKDETAPIFEYADYGLAGDLFEIIPLLIHELKREIAE